MSFRCDQCGTLAHVVGAHTCQDITDAFRNAEAKSAAQTGTDLTIDLELPRLGARAFAFRYRFFGREWWWVGAAQDGRSSVDHLAWENLLDWVAESERIGVRAVLVAAQERFAGAVRAGHALVGETLNDVDQDDLAAQTAWLARHAKALAEIDGWVAAL